MLKEQTAAIQRTLRTIYQPTAPTPATILEALKRLHEQSSLTRLDYRQCEASLDPKVASVAV